MIRINLLPFREARKKESVKRAFMIFIAVILFCGAAMIGFNNYLGVKVKELNDRVTSTKAEIEKYNKINEEIKVLREQLTVLQTKLGVIKNLEANRSTTVTLLDNLTTVIVPDNMWLTQLVTQDNTSATLNGVATDNKVVADFMLNLEEKPKYTQVTLRTLRQTELNSRPVKEFVLNLNLKTAPPLETTSPEKVAGGR